MNSPIERKAISVREAAAALAISKSGVHNLINSGRLRAGRLGKRVLISPSALDELLDSATDARVA
jgi:excisionase family DNA binding protein